MGPTVPPWMKLHAGKKFCRGGSHCTTREELEAGPTVPLRRNCEVGKNWGRSGSHCETRDEFACREEVWQGLVPLGMN